MSSLASLKPGESGIIRAVEESAVALKLLEMGCLPGETVRVISYAPLGDPISVNVSGYILSLRKKEAASVSVVPVKQPLLEV